MAKKKNIKEVEAEEIIKDTTSEIDTVEEIEETIDEEIVEDTEDDVVEEETSKKEKKNKKNTKAEKESKKEPKKEKKEGYFALVGRELKKVVWPAGGMVAKYSLAVIIFCVILVLFFVGIDGLAAFIKGLFR